MKRLFLLLGLCALFTIPSARAQTADDQYAHVHSLILQGDALEEASHPAEALAKYLEAQTELQKFQKAFPDWEKTVVTFRLTYLAGQIATISAKVPAVAKTTPSPALDNTGKAVQSTASAPSSELQDQLRSLQNQVNALAADKQILEAKLKESLATLPAAVDPRELAKAEAKVSALQKENDLLKTTLAQAQLPAAQPGDSKTVEQLKQQLAEANRKLTEATTGAAKLTSEPSAMTSGTNTQPSQDVISDLKRENDILRLEKIALANRAAQSSAPPVSTTANTAPTPVNADARIQQLVQERDELQKQLAAARNQPAAPTNQGVRPSANATETDALRARLAALESQAVPYTPEELTLFKQTSTAPAASSISSKDASVDTAKLLAEAQRMFAAREFEKAEAAYLQVLQKDPKNVFVLADLAAIEITLNHLGDAEKHIQQAVVLAPNDAYNLTVLGNLQLQQEKYDEALNTLSRAAQLSPQNARIQNFLGVTLIHKGLRKQAEDALRKAIIIDPKYGDAHNNLAGIYLTQQPPAIELARWHYKKALAAGFPPNPDIEKLLDAGKPATGTP